ncbi:CobW family GTP-binding protein [Erwinia tasmaniensis]|uniref:CobW family GTP-binding protein n=1 Tax=Erwinia tasmaniensis TaxID=338565 RepID=UPI003A4DBEAD
MARVNLITGFLGSGNPPLQHLLSQKPATEKWAILVNESGEVGIDGALLAESGAILKEIPGGCMCCVNGLPMQVGLNMLLKQAQPDRQALHDWQQQDPLSRPVITASFGRIDAQLLRQPRKNQQALPQPAHHHGQPASGLAALTLKPDARWRRSLNQGQGYFACGWVFDSDTVFDTIGLLEWVRLSPVTRVKGVMRIQEGLVSVNRQGDEFHIETRSSSPPDSRIEVIHEEEADWNALQTSLLKLRLTFV